VNIISTPPAFELFDFALKLPSDKNACARLPSSFICKLAPIHLPENWSLGGRSPVTEKKAAR
jgi:hypothetical protein